MKGSIEQLPSGRHRARRAGKTIGTYDTLTQAQAALGGATLASWWPEFLVRRRQLVRDWANDESRWELYFAHDPIANVSFPELRRPHAKAWLSGMVRRGLAPQTIKNALNLGRVLCADVIEAELLTVNPFADIRLPATYKPKSGEGFTVLDPDEQIALLDAVDDDEYHLVAFALHTGLRNSELWNLRFEDVSLEAEEMMVRRGKAGFTKTGKSRRVPLIGLARQAAEWAFANRRCEYLWPSPKAGEKRFDSSHPHRWQAWLTAAGIKRRVRFYDLRHTCATSLLAGWWGSKWSLDEVRQILGHGSVKMTERYAHLVDDTLRRAAKRTRGLDPTAWDENGSHLRDLNSRPTVYEAARSASPFELLATKRCHERVKKSRESADRLAGLILRGAELAVLLGRGEPGVEDLLAKLGREGAALLEEAASHVG
jgi:integrase